MRAGLYLRVSKDQRQGRSIEEQEVKGREDCRREGWQVASVYTDNDRGASRYSKRGRPDFARLVADIESRAVDVVVCWEASRLQRDLAVYVLLRDLCHRHGVLWSYSGRVYDLSRTDDRFQTGLDALLSEREADVTRDRVQRAVRANALAGRPHGRLLYGYRREYDAETRAFLRQVPREDQASVIRDMAARIAAGESCRSVARALNDRGIPAPRGGLWTPEQVKEQVINPGYIGKRVHRGEIIADAVWPPILDEETFYTARRILTDPRRRTMRDSAIKHLLSGLASCGVAGCGAPLRVQNNRSYLSYMCSVKFCVSVREEKLDEFVTLVLVGGKAGDVVAGATLAEDVVGRLGRPDIVDLLANRCDKEISVARAAAAEKRARLNEFYDAAAAGDLSPAALARIEARMLPEIEQLEQKAGRTIPSAVRDIAGPQAAERWKALTIEQRRAVIGTLMDIRLLPTGRGRRGPLDPRRVAIGWKHAA